MVHRRGTKNTLRYGLMALVMTIVPAASMAQDRAALAALTVINADGSETSLAERVPDAPAIVHFWATWCVPCRAELPQVDAFRQTLEPEGLSDRLVVVSVDKREFDEIAAFLEDDLGIALETLLVSNGNAGTTLGLFGYPYTLLLAPDGTIAERFPGPIEWTDPDLSGRLRAHID